MVIVEPAFPPFPQLPLYRRQLDSLWCCHITQQLELVRNSDHVFNYSMYKSIYVQTSYTGHEGGGEGGREEREEGRAWPEYAPGVVKAHHSMVGLQQVS